MSGPLGVFSPFATLRRLGVTRGLLGGSRAWTIVGVTFWAMHIVRRAASRSEETVAIEKLKPGQVLQVRALERPARSRRRSR